MDGCAIKLNSPAPRAVCPLPQAMGQFYMGLANAESAPHIPHWLQIVRRILRLAAESVSCWRAVGRAGGRACVVGGGAEGKIGHGKRARAAPRAADRAGGLPRRPKHAACLAAGRWSARAAPAVIRALRLL